jgi:predicted lipoprotein
VKRRAVLQLYAAWIGAGAGAVRLDALARELVPFYTPTDLVLGWYRDAAPRARIFLERAQTLVSALEDDCGGRLARETVRRRWREATTAWEQLSAIAAGPLITRRSLRQIDFSPTRPALIERAILSQPAGETGMARVGAPAKGLPALEWLLWARPNVPQTLVCAYAREVAMDVQREAEALSAELSNLAGRSRDAWPENEAKAAVEELVNQWIAAVERLRWAQMEKPLRSGTPQALPRQLSGSTAESWQAHWAAIVGLARARNEAPAPGAGLVSFELYLRGRGLDDLANRWAAVVDTADTRVRAANPKIPSTVVDAARALAELKRLAEAELAPTLDVRLGFSDADGD